MVCSALFLDVHPLFHWESIITQLVLICRDRLASSVLDLHSNEFL